MNGSPRRLAIGLCSAAALAAAAPAAAEADVWNGRGGTPPAAGAEVKPERFRAFTLDKSELRAGLTRALKAGAARPDRRPCSSFRRRPAACSASASTVRRRLLPR
jgi:hypothetical protein